MLTYDMPYANVFSFLSNKIQFAYHRRKYKYKIPKKLKFDLFQFSNIKYLFTLEIC